MNKSQLILNFIDKNEITQVESKKFINCFFKTIEESLLLDKWIIIRNFGSLKTKKYKSYTGRNPKSGSIVLIKSKRAIVWKPGKELKERVNSDGL